MNDSYSLPIFTAAITATVFALLTFLPLFAAYVRAQSFGARAVMASAILAVFVTLPVIYEVALSTLNRTAGLSRIMIDPPWYWKVAPGLCGAAVAALVAGRHGRRFDRTT